MADDVQPLGYLSLAARKAAGAHYTPEPLARFVAGQMLAGWPASGAARAPRVLDPAVGDGGLLLALLGELAGHGVAACEVSGYDTDPHAVDAARARLAGRFPGVSLRLMAESFLQVSAGDRQLAPGGPGEAGPYDLVIANPPYIRTQLMGAASAQALAGRFGLSGRVDLYHAFIAGIARALRPGGVAGIIVSNRFMTTRAGASVRAGLSRQCDILHVWDLGDTRLFEAAVLPAVLLVRRKGGAAADQARFTSIYAARGETAGGRCRDVIEALGRQGLVKTDRGEVYRVLQGTLARDAGPGGVWRLASATADAWLQAVQARTARTFKEVGDVRVGVKTTADRVFIRSDWADLPPDRRPELLRPLTTHHVARRFRPLAPSRPAEILYPHTVVDGKRVAVRLADFPRSAGYLNDHRAALEARAYVRKAGRHWYEIWVPQDPAAWAQPKVVFRDIVDRPAFWMDLGGSVVNGDCYWLAGRAAESPDWLWLVLAVGNSSFIETFYDRRFNNKLYAGRRRFMTQYVEQFPLPDLHTDAAQAIVALAKDIYAALPARDTTGMEAQLDALVWQAFGVS